MPGSCRDLVSGNDDHSFGVMQTRQVDKATRLSKSETDHVAWWTRERLPQANVEGRLKTHPMAGFPNPTRGHPFSVFSNSGSVSCAENSEACTSLPPSTCATRHTVASFLVQLWHQENNSGQWVAGLALCLIPTDMTSPVAMLSHASVSCTRT